MASSGGTMANQALIGLDRFRDNRVCARTMIVGVIAMSH
jgi:hypothetical protein